MTYGKRWRDAAVVGAAVTLVAVALPGSTPQTERVGDRAAGLLPAGDREAASSAQPQARPDASALLRAVAGTPPVACELVVRALGNRWGSRSVHPQVHRPGALSAADQALADWSVTAGTDADPTEGAALLEGLDAGDPCVQRVAARMLGMHSDPSTRTRLEERAASGPAASRVVAIMALGYAGRSAARGEPHRVLENALAAGDIEVRRAAAWALGEGERRGSVAALSVALRDADLALRENAAWALGQTESREGLDPLVRALGDAEASVRVNAAWALGQIEDGRAIRALAALVDGDRDVRVRQAAAWALGNIEG